MRENSHFDKKSLSIVTNKANWKELAKDCVCFANGVGGKILIGIEDDQDAPNPKQRIDDFVIEQINKRIPGLTIHVAIMPQIVTHKNGGQYIELNVLRSKQSIASTTDGKYYMRVSDECKPIMPDHIERLASEKSTFTWEERIVRKYELKDCDTDKLKRFLGDIEGSERISSFIKQKAQEEICEHYFLIDSEGFMTNLGVLWLGTRQQRALLHYAPSVQFIKYDDNEKKINKKVWDDFDLNPKELINNILNDLPEWNEFVEISDGIFRKNIYNYPPEAIREIIANAFAHRNYTMQGDIFINLYSDRLEIHSPGLLPLGVTPSNILTKSVQRNTFLSKLFYDLKLMEKEGSGYDKVYEVLLENGKQVPQVYEGDDRVVVTLKKQIVSRNVLKLMDKASKELQLRQKEVITLGMIAQKEGVSATELSKSLNVSQPNGLQHWIGRLNDLRVILSKGKTKGTFYYVNPKFIRTTDFVEKTNLKRIEPHRLKELIYEDLKNYPQSSIGEINQRIGYEIKQRTLKVQLDKMIGDDSIYKEGERRWTKYSINKNR